jgi:hypothetical protein
MSRFQRPHSFREPKKFFIIATEGECTEEIYFNAFKPGRDSKIQLKVLPTKQGHSNPKEVLARLHKYEREIGTGLSDELWVVIDRDNWEANDLNTVAAEIAKHSKYNLALSNPCFELWLVLHFQDSSGQDSKGLEAILKKQLGRYDKSYYDVDTLITVVGEAIKRAERIDADKQALWPRNYGTRVYRLVTKLI